MGKCTTANKMEDVDRCVVERHRAFFDVSPKRKRTGDVFKLYFQPVLCFLWPDKHRGHPLGSLLTGNNQCCSMAQYSVIQGKHTAEDLNQYTGT